MVNHFSFFFDVAKNMIPRIRRIIEIIARIHNHRLRKLFRARNKSGCPVVHATMDTIQNTKLTKSRKNPMMSGEITNRSPNVLFMGEGKE